MNHIKFSFNVSDQAEKEALIARLSVLDFTGFEETDDQLIAYAGEDQYDDATVKEIAKEMGLPFSSEALAERNWNEEWEKNFQPVIIDGFCSVRADFHPRPENVQFDIVITPKMSFGTGHHATTALMMSFMKEINLQDKKVFDFGTGTGILAILAEMLGAASVSAIDNDEWSYLNALENCQRNHMEHITVRQATIDELPAGSSFDIILANINRHILLAYMANMARVLAPGGILLLSGILPEDMQMIGNAAGEEGLELQKERVMNNWACMQFGNPPARQ